jgi:hypothetical protein
MSTENEVQEVAVEEVQAEAPQVEETQVEANEDAAFQAGFDSANGIEQPEPEPVPEPKLIAGYTEEQIKELVSTVEALKQRESKIFGSMGSLKQSIDSLKSTPQQSQALALSPDKFKRLSADYPELAALLAEDLNGMSVAGQPNSDQFEQRLKTSVEETTKAFETKLLTVQHRDWKTVVASEDFVGWKETLPADEKEALDASWDAEFIGEKISAYKDWKAKASQSKQTNQKRLEAAITPKGNASGKPNLSETDAFLAGFKAVRG